LTLEVRRCVPLTDGHDTSEFSCKRSESLDSWIQGPALAVVASQTATVWVMTPVDTESVLGYFALSNHVMKPTDVASKDKNGSSTANMPATLLGKIALHVDHQGAGLGAILVHEMFAVAAHGATFTGSRYLVLHAENEALVRYYATYGFKAFRSDPSGLDMYMKMSRVKDIVEKNGFART
jgi:GNAT superfamily N-acetyltransferase